MLATMQTVQVLRSPHRRARADVAGDAGSPTQGALHRRQRPHMPQWARSSRSGIGYQAGPGETVPVMGSSEVYTHGHTEGVLRSHRWRTAENSAGYLLPHLRAGQRLLDLGCGPGTISVDLARRVAPGPVVGVDRAEPPLREARATAAAAAVDNVTFAVGDAYQLDFPAGSFDVVHAHQVLQHLSDPVAALVEMRRVCAPGGWIAVRDADYAAMTWHPADLASGRRPAGSIARAVRAGGAQQRRRARRRAAVAVLGSRRGARAGYQFGVGVVLRHRRGRRRRRQSVARRHAVFARFSDEEFEVLAVAAAAVGLTPTGYVASTAVAVARGQVRPMPAGVGDVVRELVEARAQLVRYGVLLRSSSRCSDR